ncbi:MAG TPA: MBL fold metallo-hydrolase [Sphingomicrobium sp.]|nr:MBL fold metallo-hydrolase [Sphingomicrobium sp.]
MKFHLLVAAFLLSFSSARPAAAAAPLPFVVKQVGPGVYACIDGPEHKSGSNAGFVIGDNGVLVVDSFFTPEAAQALVGEIHRLTAKPILYIVNSHYHLDHTGGDQVLRDAGAIIIAHRNVRAWLRTYNIHLFGDRITPELQERIERLPLPDIVTDTSLAIWLGSRKVVIRAMPGHTGGDLTIFVPDARVLFTGDLFWRKVPPNLIDGTVSDWVATDRAFAEMPSAERLVYVPGHGDVGSDRDVRDFRAYLVDLEKLVSAGRGAHLAGDALVRSIAPKLRMLHRDWIISDRAVGLEIRYMDEELAGTKSRPVSQPD